MSAVGFFGKLPARGDFVRAGLPRGFVTPWDIWLRCVLPASRAILGDAWESAWLEAPVWRFAFPAGLCGPDPVLGLWMPSVDRAGRWFPLMLGRVGDVPGGDILAYGAPAAGGHAGGMCEAAVSDDGPGAGVLADLRFLAAMEEIGRSAIAEDWAPDTLTARLCGWRDLDGTDGECTSGANCAGAVCPDLVCAPGTVCGASRWWTDGGPRCPPTHLLLPGLPDVVTFAHMLDAEQWS